jgi:signal transduction histidine kinase
MAPALPSRSDRPPVIDIAIAGALALVLLIISPRIPDETGQRAIDAGGYALILLAAGVLALRQIWPRGTLAVATGAVVAFALLDYKGGPVYLTPLVALATIAYLKGRREAVVPAVIVTATLLAAGFVHDRSYPTVLVHLLFVSWSVAAVLIGDAIRSRAQQVAALRERARVLEETREEEARRRVAEERVRIARDLHDVVAHSLASISIQAGTGAHVIDRQPDQARAALLAIKTASKEALDQLRATLDVLRERDGAAAPVAPTAGLGTLSSLVSAAEQAGVEVTVEHEVAGPVPPALDVTAFRIVQESLTNVMRHAHATRADVRVSLAGDVLEIEIVDDGVGDGSTSADDEAPGHGITGMRERASLLGGRVVAGPRSDGPGWRVHAVLPVPASEAAEATGP